MARRNGHHNNGDTPIVDHGSGVAGRRGRGRPKRDPDKEVAQIGYPGEDDITKFLGVFRTRKSASQEANQQLGEHVSAVIKGKKWPRRGVRMLLALVQLTPVEAQATMRWLMHAFERTEHGRQTDLLDDVLARQRDEAEAEAATEPATI